MFWIHIYWFLHRKYDELIFSPRTTKKRHPFTMNFNFGTFESSPLRGWWEYFSRASGFMDFFHHSKDLNSVSPWKEVKKSDSYMSKDVFLFIMLDIDCRLFSSKFMTIFLLMLFFCSILRTTFFYFVVFNIWFICPDYLLLFFSIAWSVQMRRSFLRMHIFHVPFLLTAFVVAKPDSHVH